ncbi:hypothetical protein A3H10_03120 [Candidatus Uhrbacteria bacterium RIFCSPLOWO2_12_FULL_46_10]|uniref:Uncharacterized protein n=1 Tax=Candidatus Uhrbacteria bacterium RIFCSPLOWO2_01_FULL_47_25 TaxID=1802402 RepID=A0A1F7UXQ0_9BACT|nr:MAG: hypothetical protein UX68_C0030G0002 [Parcubacteria group bacterium GW2011_GWA2_46_9]OGL59735.1 MAG: hypothetical protein A2752_03015 [Candidatus Uhrbacteria bacterium RIFCSPHIGHO2_01_FULL_46_23]OGL83063.1 MAG: hypothetical protein A2936_05090 [Candidatus Uhrbacteria bacterium RIFCSPLOWO2_01_FULL_47_25]OGL84153.1 MAG: hypothetical protein A3I37_03200 [Candidatus Uhrbacteria bacterium RIFCSPLOWO2_02_FULL_46_19]OGL90746.1 MAG: hypothetical protein A3H10_03120 [Candidatus Uhrbacteria bacte
MGERPKTLDMPEGETLEQKKERLRPVFRRSLEVFQNPDRPLREGALTVTREFNGEIETVPGLVVLDILDDAVELGGIEDDGEIGASAFMTWEEILDAKEEGDG